MTPEDVMRVFAFQEAGLWQGILVFLRVAPVMSLIPGFSEQSVPMRVRLGIALAMTMIVAPVLPSLAPNTAFSLPVALRFMVTETLSGLVLGLGLRMFILALQTAGSMAAQATSLSQILGGAGAEPLPAFGHILVMGGLAFAMMMGLHLRAAEYLIASYDVLPAGRFPLASDLAEWGVAQVAAMFALAFRIAMPFIIVSVLYNLTLGVVNRAMPQLMVAFVGAPVITAGGLVLLALLSPMMIALWFEALAGFLDNPFRPVP
ncbi:MAG: flagellar biosynthetic protein FliR [Pseudooceanicola sp.]